MVDVSTPGPGGGISAPLEVAVIDPGELIPNVAAGGVVDAASYDVGLGVAPGSIASVFGSQLALVQETAVFNPLPTTLGGGSVVIDESVEVPLYFGSDGQYNIQIPWQLPDVEVHQLQVRLGATISEAQPFETALYSPGLFSADGTGTGQAAALIAGSGGILAAPSGYVPGARPVRPGEYLMLFANGLGPVLDTPAPGSAAPAFPLSVSLTQPVVRLNGEPIPVVFSGLAPGFVGLYQVNVKIPNGVQPDDAALIDIEIGGVRSRSLTVAVGTI